LFLNSPRPVLGGQEAVLPSPDPQQIQTQTTFKLPLTAGYISQKYTWYHQGVDITGPLKTPIYPIAEGQVKEVSFSKLGYGHSIIIEHENSFESLYAHLGEIKVRQGDKVAKETVIGVVGMTGFTTGPHLHLEVRKQNSLLDPLTVLPDFKLSKETGGQ
jgi:murein DD-endopeptidase MepM/ murein hydrolase activator NlpD